MKSLAARVAVSFTLAAALAATAAAEKQTLTHETLFLMKRVGVPATHYKCLIGEENHWILNGENSRNFYKEVADWLARWM